MRRVWLFGFLAALAIAAGFLFLTERPLTVTVAPGLRNPRFGRDITFDPDRRTRKSGVISAVRLNDGSVSLYSWVTRVGTGAPATNDQPSLVSSVSTRRTPTLPRNGTWPMSKDTSPCT